MEILILVKLLLLCGVLCFVFYYGPVFGISAVVIMINWHMGLDDVCTIIFLSSVVLGGRSQQLLYKQVSAICKPGFLINDSCGVYVQK